MKVTSALGLLLAATAVLVPVVACSGGSGGTGGFGDLGSSGSSGENGNGNGNGENGGSSNGGPTGTPSNEPAPSSSTSPAPTGSGGGGNIVCGNGSTSDFCYCSVNNSGAPPGGACSAATVGGVGGCCASTGWPSTGSCQCTQYKCEKRGTDCNCWLHSADGANLASSCSPTAGQVCCVTSSGVGNVCQCRTGTSCGPGSKQVSSCTLASTGCESDEMPVPACR